MVDYCYEQNEKNDLVFEREVKPFINEVFDGRNATIIACGARGTGKSYLFQVFFLNFFYYHQFFFYLLTCESERCCLIFSRVRMMNRV